MEPSSSGAQAELKEHLIRLTQEKEDLQDYAERVTRELRRYQQARPPPQSRAEDDMPLPPWATNMQMMTPLLFAYEERIAELEEVIERSVCLAEQAQVLTKENDSLRVELHDRTEQLRNLQLMAPVRDAGRDGPQGDQGDEVQELYRLSVEQNEALAQQNQLLKLQLEKMHAALAAAQRQSQEAQAQAQAQAQAAQAQAQAAQAQAAEGARERSAVQERTTTELAMEKQAAARALSAEQERSEVLARQRSAAEQRLNELVEQLYGEVEAREQMSAQVERLEKDLQASRQSTAFYKKNFEDHCASARDEEEMLQGNLARAVANEREFRERAQVLERELAEVTDQLFATRRDGDAMKHEAEQMLRLMESMERRLRDVSEKHDRVQRELAEKGSELDDLLLQKDAWLTNERSLRRQVDRLESRMQGEMQDLMQHQDHEFESLQAAHKKSVSEAEEQLRRCEQQVREMQTKADIAERKAQWGAATVERQAALHKVESDRLATDLEEALQERLRAERQLDGAQQETSKLRAELEAVAGELRESAVRASSELAASKQRIQSLERSVSQAREEAQTCEARVRTAALDSSYLQAEVREERAKVSERVEAERERASTEKRGFERQLQALQARAQKDEQRAVELLHAQEALRQRLQAELNDEKDALEAQVARLSRENRSLREKSRSVLRALAVRQVGPGGSLGDILGSPH
mmetsp:Transcript_48290/g.138867  ORF Transcript_48290/g.138867 Transcript_48290/m.138867 type:complete len:700 (-) Transcript_48290:26-2125(-)